MGKRSKRVALVVKRTALDRHREQADDRIAVLLARKDPTVARLEAAHAAHVETVDEVKSALTALKADCTRIRKRRERFDASRFDLVVTVGGDGTLLHTSHSVGADIPMLAINSSPTSSVGFFCGAKKGEAAEALERALAGDLGGVKLTRMQVALNDEVVDARVLNDALFCHQSPAATSRYIIEHEGLVEEHKSSGIWVGPAAGSTAAQRSAGGKVLPLTSQRLQLVVREPYTPTGEPYAMRRVIIESGSSVRLRSKSRRMRLYLDGPDVMIKVTIGDVLTFAQSEEPLRLLGIGPNRRQELRMPG